MANDARPTGPWSDALGRALLEAVPDAQLARHWGAPAGHVAGGQIRQELLGWARQDEDVRHWIIQAWRHEHPDLVAAVDHALTAGLGRETVRTLADFAAADVLLALVTDEFNDGAAQARLFLNTAFADKQRRPLLAALRPLLGEVPAAAPRRARVVIIGGLQRDESRLGEQPFKQSPFDLRWKAFEKKQGPGAILKAVADALRHADAVIIVVGMASDALVQVARQEAERRGIRWRCVPRASDGQLMDALFELFPELG